MLNKDFAFKTGNFIIVTFIMKENKYYTTDIMNKVPGVYTHSMEIIYLSLSAQVAVGTFFWISLVLNGKNVAPSKAQFRRWFY